jgi:hypothetical protein
MIRSVFEFAVERRRGKKSTGQLQNFIGATLLCVLAFSGLDAFTLVAGDAFARTRINLLLTYSCKAWGTQPILADMDSMAAHREGYSPRCSRTIRTARSRTPGGNFADVLMAPCPQMLEPRQNPGRFTHTQGIE